MGRKADIRRCIKSCGKMYETPTTSFGEAGKGFAVTVLVTPACKVRVGLFAHDSGVSIRAYYGIDCPYDAVDRLLPILNEINAGLIRGCFVLDSDRTLVFQNFYPVDDPKKFDKGALAREVNVCVRTFYGIMGEIMPVVAAPAEEPDGDTYVIEVV
ncbi:MAG: hypothetical protein Q4Q62_05450 [Thermoplasmata archaeon]|nr:hypothetical protein [Thermoplasmata archaeon]